MDKSNFHGFFYPGGKTYIITKERGIYRYKPLKDINEMSKIHLDNLDRRIKRDKELRLKRGA